MSRTNAATAKQIRRASGLLNDNDYPTQWMSAQHKNAGATMRERSGLVDDWLAGMDRHRIGRLIDRLTAPAPEPEEPMPIIETTTTRTVTLTDARGNVRGTVTHESGKGGVTVAAESFGSPSFIRFDLLPDIVAAVALIQAALAGDDQK